MDYQVLARKWRPMVFSDVVGQPHVVQTLTHAIQEQRVAHAYLFSGMRGTGKTTVARILAKGLNCDRGPTPAPCGECHSCIEILKGHSFDVIEIDAATETGVENVRQLQEAMVTAPTTGRRRVYIIDEIHMLSKAAFNAFLKTLEEPPAHVIFVFATTERESLPETVLSRCQTFQFRRLSVTTIADHLRHIMTEETITMSDRGIQTIANAADGSLRDALSLLDQVISFSGEAVEDSDVDIVLGNIPSELRREMIQAVVARDAAKALEVVWAVGDQGGNLSRFLCDLIEDVRALIVMKVSPSSLSRLNTSEVLDRDGEAAIKALTVENLQEIFDTLIHTQDSFRHTEFGNYVLEMAVIKICKLELLAGSRDDSDAEMDAKRTTRQEVSRAKGSSVIMQPSPPSRDFEASKRRSQGNPSRDQMAARRGQSPKPLKPQAVSEDKKTRVGETFTIDWTDLVERVGREKPNLATYLEAGAPIKVENGIVLIGFSESRDMCREVMAREDNQRYVQKVCESVCGRPIELKFVRLTKSPDPVKTIGDLTQEKHKKHEQDLHDQTLTDPSVRMLLDEFGGQLQEVREDSVHEGEER